MDKISNIRGTLLLEGVLFIILGALAIALPGLFTLGIELFIGWLFIFGGAVQAYRSFKSKESSTFWATLLASLVSIVFGILLVAFPVTGIVSLTIVLAIFFLLDGATKIALAFQSKPMQGWGWFLFSGLISIALAFIILSGLPGTAAWVIGLLVGINMLFFGFSLLAIGNAIPKNPS